MPSKPRLLALLGDSILDNGTYTSPAPDTATHLRKLLGAAWRVELAARDGATMNRIAAQLATLPPGRPDVVVLSVGGNDVLGHIELLSPRMASTTDLLTAFHVLAEDFAAQYENVLELLRPKTDRLIACTIYEVDLSDRETARLARVPIAVLDDRIVRAAKRRGADVLELRDVCTAPSDFVMEIEPSGDGARKIATAIATAVRA